MKKTAMDIMREHAANQYDNLLTNYNMFQVDDEYLDQYVAECLPQRIRNAVATDAGKAIWGLHPFINSKHVTYTMLGEIIERLDAITKWCDAGHEFDYYCVYDEATGKIRFEGNDDDWYTDESGEIVYISE